MAGNATSILGATMTASQRPDQVLHVTIEPPTPDQRQPAGWWTAVLVAQAATGVFAGLAMVAIGTAAVIVLSR
jgi:uncharacterized membrane protein